MWTIKKVEDGLRVVKQQLLDGTITAEQFKMDITLDMMPCGTVGCIGGWMMYADFVSVHERMPTRHDSMRLHLRLVVEEAKEDDEMRGRGLDRLFYQWPEMYMENDIGVGDACAAIDQWLNGNNDPWHPLRREMGSKQLGERA